MSWYNTVGKACDTVISSRVRLARNINGYPFASKMSVSQADELIKKVSGTLESSGFQKIDFADISSITAASYVEKHYVSPEFAAKSTPHVLFMQEVTGIAIMCCEEDHLRIQAILPGLALEDAYKNALLAEQRLDEDFDFSYSQKLGYLTQCPTNIGTGMRASVMMFLPTLTKGGYMDALATQLSKIGLTVRGLYGEGSGSMGSIYQISNQITLGISEEETLRKLNEAINQISESEKKAREHLSGDSLDRVTDRIRRAEGALRYAHLMSSSEFIKHFSDVRLGIAMGIIHSISYEQLGTLLVEAMPATLTLSTDTPPKTETARDKLRAQYIQSIFKT